LSALLYFYKILTFSKILYIIKIVKGILPWFQKKYGKEEQSVGKESLGKAFDLKKRTI